MEAGNQKTDPSQGVVREQTDYQVCIVMMKVPYWDRKALANSVDPDQIAP